MFVHEYNLYYQSDPERPGTAVQITNDGEEFFRYGVTDWLYEGIPRIQKPRHLSIFRGSIAIEEGRVVVPIREIYILYEVN